MKNLILVFTFLFLGFISAANAQYTLQTFATVSNADGVLFTLEYAG